RRCQARTGCLMPVRSLHVGLGVLLVSRVAMPPDYDWHDVRSVDHQDGDPLARFAPETPSPAQQIAQPGGVAQPGAFAQPREQEQSRELVQPRAIAEPRFAALPAEPELYYTPAPDPRPVR